MSATDWWMYHRDQNHSGLAQGSTITSANVAGLQLVADVPVPGPVVCVPAIVNGFVYVGVANSNRNPGSNGGTIMKIALDGSVAAYFDWPLIESYPPNPVTGGAQDQHFFTGMACTPAISGGFVYFSAFDGCVYCLDAETLELVWKTNLRQSDLAHNQPVDNTMSDVNPAPGSPAVGWSSPVVADGNVYVGFGEGENPNLFGFVYCLDGATGNVVWLYCLCPLVPGTPNAPNVIPPGTWLGNGNPPAPFTLAANNPTTRGIAIWSSIAYDSGVLYCSTGNAAPDNGLPQPGTPAQDLSNSIVSLDATNGTFIAQFAPDASTNYRATDDDVDFGGSPTVFTLNGNKVVAAGCKNGGIFLLDAKTLKLLAWRQLLPYENGVLRNGTPIDTVDLHDNGPGSVGENFSGTYSTPAVHPADDTGNGGMLFIGVGGNNYHSVSFGIDSTTTPFLRALKWDTLDDAWPLTTPAPPNPPLYANASPPMYTTAGESGLSSPAVVNDVVFCSTTGVSVYAFAAQTGTMLWKDKLGSPTFGVGMGGFGYCMGPAVSGDYVVAGGLVVGGTGGVLRIYSLPQT